MSPAIGLIIAFALIAIGGVGLAVFAITHRQREDDLKKTAPTDEGMPT